MRKNHHPCDLCGQPVKLAGFHVASATGLKKFCCEGCLRIFQLLDPEQNLTHQLPEKIS
jgi:hypothetical protein